MAFANPWLMILGSLFVAVPIILHLVMRRKPKQLVFPALRFVKQKRETNRRRLQLRQWLLLALRCLGILALAAALSRPSVVSSLLGNWTMIGLAALLLVAVGGLAAVAWIQQKGRLLAWTLTAIAVAALLTLLGLLFMTLVQSAKLRIGDRQAPVSAVLVIDTSPRMQYRQANLTRLQQAQRTAQWLLRQMPAGSRVAIADLHPGDPFYSADLGAAQKRIEVLRTTYVRQSLIRGIEKAVRLASDSERTRREVYVLTDMTEAAWSQGGSERLKRQLEKTADVALYLIDVGADRPENFSLGDLQLHSESIPKSGELHLVVPCSSLGTGGSRTLELRLEKPDLTKPIVVDGQVQLPDEQWVRTADVELGVDDSQQVEFYLGGLELGVHQGLVQIVGEDGLSVDNQRFFTVQVNSAWPVLVAAPRGVTTTFLTEAIAPYQERQTGAAAFDCTVIEQQELVSQQLDDFAAVALLDPEPLGTAAWEALEDFVQRGGRLAMFLGHHAAEVDSFNGPVAQRLLAGPLASLTGRSAGDLYLTSPNVFDHPITADLRPIATSIPWREFPIHRYWVFESLADECVQVLRFSNGRPALVDRQVGEGRVVTMTTPISDPSRPSGRKRWNDLPLGNAWPYFILINNTFAYLAQSGASRMNYTVGQTVTLENSASQYPEQYYLFSPGGPPLSTQAQNDQLIISATTRPGAYRLRGSRGGPVVRGFCANVDADVSRLERMDVARLDELLGADRYRLARDQEEIHRGQGEARVGREFYPMLVTVLAVLLGVELLMANRFYAAPQEVGQTPPRRSG